MRIDVVIRIIADVGEEVHVAATNIQRVLTNESLQYGE
jgi:hypothetical protein